jgi:Tfp pilus assembly protein PilE
MNTWRTKLGFDLLDHIGLSDDSHVTAPQSLVKLPAYALDGRKLDWNADYTAVRFESTDHEYHSDSDAVSASALKLMDRSPAHLHEDRIRRKNNPNSGNTAAMAFGTAVHAAVLENAQFANKYALYKGPVTKATRNTNAFKEFCESIGDKRAILKDEVIAVTAAAKNLLSTVVVKTEKQQFTMDDLVSLGVAEQNYYWVDAQTGLTCKARMDLTVQNLVIDVKTALDARKERFMYDAGKLGYHIQAAFYIAGYSMFHGSGKPIIMVFAVVENKAPYATKVYQADKDAFWGAGQKRVRELLASYKRCVETNVWTGYSTETELLKLPISKLYGSQSFNY